MWLGALPNHRTAAVSKTNTMGVVLQAQPACTEDTPIHRPLYPHPSCWTMRSRGDMDSRSNLIHFEQWALHLPPYMAQDWGSAVSIIHHTDDVTENLIWLGTLTYGPSDHKFCIPQTLCTTLPCRECKYRTGSWEFKVVGPWSSSSSCPSSSMLASSVATASDISS